ncbi:putative acyl-protein thioesterase 1 [Rosellinia necatrix]|uniref:Acyl-protein thioesterase 1 n=1 Tax=Rosellinia necatrix TaxID=77044 RepID=A0A1W2TPB3_ROSNE|nr:putative acyl-protein thioesterase 1 [Rosellinia necatrix]
MAMQRAKPLFFSASAKHTATVIFLHGLGDTGFGWASAVEGWIRGNKLDEVKWVLPHAPRLPITAAGGMPMPGWFDIASLNGGIDDIRSNQDEPGLLRTRDYVNSLIQAEIDAGIPSNRIILGGFSQGGAMALLSGLTAKVKLGGIVGLSCWLPLDTKFPSLVQASDLNHETPIYMAHGSIDPVVPTAFGQMSYEALKKQNFAAKMKLFTGMPHSACQEELDEVEAFIHSHVPPQEDKKTEL